MEVWSGMWVPHGTPRPIIDKLNGAVVAALAEPAVREKLASVGLDGPPAGQEAPEALGAFQKAEAAKWWPIIKAANVTAE
jgi:tripartite-type tricarboxylate transporter receptor subunit TctC